MVLVLLQVLVCVLFVAISMRDLLNGEGAGTLLSSQPFFDPQVSFPSLLAILPLLCFSFPGFDAVTTLAEETIEPEKTMPKAVMLITLLGGTLFVIVTYFAQLVQPNFQAFSSPDSAGMELFMQIGGNLLSAFFLAVVVLAAVASAVASGASGARILYAMGREGVLPKGFFGYLSPRFRTPVWNIIVIAVVAMMANFLDMLTATALINFGALLAFVFVNIAVIFHFYIRHQQRSGKGIILYLLLPLVGALFTGVFWMNLGATALILGGCWFLVGLGYLLYLTKLFRQPPPSLHFEEAESFN
ncbi:APC family permease [Brevibacillus invocatus]|uniref:APC family permease n=1 Tax=Brevibacillus invocatus TaxID=173959 RepID=UPI0020414153|nr:APC family permease [Brevibacillus invocatus]MCM3428252.1 APC family permease [Brevibacillus invocatus]